MSVMFSASRANVLMQIKIYLYLLGLFALIPILWGICVHKDGFLLGLFFMIPPLLAIAYHTVLYIPLHLTDSYRASLDDETRTRIERALPLSQLAATQGELDYFQWKKYADLHRRLEACDLKELEEKLAASGIFNPHVSEFTKLKPMGDILTLSIWQSKYEKEQILQRAAEEDFKKATADAITSSDLTQRRDAEARKDINGAESIVPIPWELDNFSGVVTLFYQGKKCTKLALDSEPGNYSVVIEDKEQEADGQRKIKALLTLDGSPVELVFPAPITNGTVKLQRGDRSELIVLSS